MPTSYSPLLGLALPVTGELSGTWGDTLNNYITTYLDSSVAGTQIISGSQTAVTLSPTNGASLVQVGSGLTGSSQYGIIRCSGNPAGTLTITVSYPSLTNAQFSQRYAVINATSTNQSVIVRATTGTGTSSGVTLVAGESAVLAWNGTDFIKIATSAVDGVSTFSAGTTGFTPSTATSGAVTLAGTLATTNGGTGLTSFTANGVVYASSTSALTTGSALTFDGSNFVVNPTNTQFYVGSSFAKIQNNSGASASFVMSDTTDSGTIKNIGSSIAFINSASEGMRLTSTGLKVGATSGGTKLYVYDAGNTYSGAFGSGGGAQIVALGNSAGVAVIQGFSNNAFAAYSDLVVQPGGGNLGLGVTPSASSLASFQSTYGIFVGSSQANIAANAYYNAGWKYVQTGVQATRYSQLGPSAHVWEVAPSGTAGNAISFTQAMTLDASGRLLVGATSSSGARLDVVSGAGANTYFNSTAAGIYLQIANNSTNLGYIGDGGSLISGGGNTDFAIRSQAALTFATNGNTERARIDSSGNFGIGLTPVANNGILQVAGHASVQALLEKATVSATAATGTINFDALTQAVLYYTSNASANWTVNVRGNSGTSLNTIMQTGQSITLAFLVTQGSTAYYNSAFQIDGASVTPKWQGGTAPSSGNASSIDVYVYTVIKTASATFTVLASQTKFA